MFKIIKEVNDNIHIYLQYQEDPENNEKPPYPYFKYKRRKIISSDIPSSEIKFSVEFFDEMYRDGKFYDDNYPLDYLPRMYGFDIINYIDPEQKIEYLKALKKYLKYEEDNYKNYKKDSKKKEQELYNYVCNKIKIKLNKKVFNDIFEHAWDKCKDEEVIACLCDLANKLDANHIENMYDNWDADRLYDLVGGELKQLFVKNYGMISKAIDISIKNNYHCGTREIYQITKIVCKILKSGNQLKYLLNPNYNQYNIESIGYAIEKGCNDEQLKILAEYDCNEVYDIVDNIFSKDFNLNKDYINLFLEILEYDFIGSFYSSDKLVELLQQLQNKGIKSEDIMSHLSQLNVDYNNSVGKKRITKKEISDSIKSKRDELIKILQNLVNKN